jgi:hypothetical protein
MFERCSLCYRWGALGLSRKSTLMYKELKFDSFSAVMESYKEAYESCWHELTKVPEEGAQRHSQVLCRCM